MKTKLFALIAVIALGAAVIGTAQAGPAKTSCPPNWTEQSGVAAGRYDRNGDGTICVKQIPNSKGKGNTGTGANYKDNNNP
jgi:hypothetical protein